jgi:hypothetical protein
MTALSELLPAGGAGKVMDFVASGTLPNGRPVILKSDGTVEVVFQAAGTATNLTSTNFVGITSKSIADTATGSITLQGGVSTNQSSLTSGSTYYVQADGTVSTVSTAPAVNIGKALNATTLKLKGLSI